MVQIFTEGHQQTGTSSLTLSSTSVVALSRTRCEQKGAVLSLWTLTWKPSATPAQSPPEADV